MRWTNFDIPPQLHQLAFLGKLNLNTVFTQSYDAGGTSSFEAAYS